MPHAFAVVRCYCSKTLEYHAFSHDNNEFLEPFKCDHFTCSVKKRCQIGYLLGFNQLAGLYFDVMCIKCGKQINISYEAGTFGKKNEDKSFKCCGSILNFNFSWAH